MTSRQNKAVRGEFLPGLLGSLAVHALVIGVILFAATMPVAPQMLSAMSVQMVTLSELGLEAEAPLPAAAQSKHLTVPEQMTAPRKTATVKPASVSRSTSLKPATKEARSSANSASPNSTHIEAAADGGGQGLLMASGSGDRLEASRLGALRTSYEQLIARRLEMVKRYPRKALMRNVQGSVLLQLEILRHGGVRSQGIRESSGFSFLDEEVLAMVERVGDFPPFPAEIPDDSLAYVVPVSFRLTSR
jgi:protein TonB